MRKTKIANRPLKVHEKDEGSVYPSVGKKRPLFSLGKGNKRVPDYVLFLSGRRKRAYQSSPNYQKEKLCTSSPTRVESFLQSNEAEESSISKHETDRPLQDKRFSLGKEILTIPFTASKDGREHTLKKKKRWSSPQLSNKDVWSSPQPPKRKRTPPPHALQQEEGSFQVVRASL